MRDIGDGDIELIPGSVGEHPAIHLHKFQGQSRYITGVETLAKTSLVKEFNQIPEI